MMSIQVDPGPTDTVLADPARVTVEVHDSLGDPIAGALVYFRAIQDSSVFYVMRSGLQERTILVIDTTDSQGKARADIWHWWRAGLGTLRIQLRSPTSPFAVLDSAFLAVRTTPGRINGVTVTPPDTALYEGNSVEFVVKAIDQSGNQRPESGNLEALSSGLAVQGMTARAITGPSRQRVRGRLGQYMDSAWISVVPRGTILVRPDRLVNGDQYLFATMQLDGSELAGFLDFRSGVGSNDKFLSPQWGANGDYLLLSGGYPQQQLYRVDLAGVITPLFPARITASDKWQQQTLDGSWVYFTGTTGSPPPGTYQTGIYRARLDGSEATRLSPDPVGYPYNDLYPSPSPDGAYVVYTSDLGLTVLSVASGVTQKIHDWGGSPRWSPSGEWIAFGATGGLYVIHPDGTGFRILSANDLYEPWASWSPDGRFLVAEHYGPYIEVIEVSTGLRLPLLFTGFLTTPAWRPTPN